MNKRKGVYPADKLNCIKAKQKKAIDLVCCAKEAALNSPLVTHGNSLAGEDPLAVLEALKSPPEYFSSSKGWRHACIRALWDESGRTFAKSRQVRVWFAFTTPSENESVKREGHLAEMELTVIRPGNGAITPYPADALMFPWTAETSSFHEALEDAWAMVRPEDDFSRAVWRVIDDFKDIRLWRKTEG